MTRALVALLFVLAAAIPAPALGHAVLVSSTPADREVLQAAPDSVILRFNEPVKPIAMTLRDRDGKALDLPAVVAVDRELRLRPAAPLAPGAYVLSYRVVSADSHPIGGSILFAVGTIPTSWEPPATAQDASWLALAAGQRFVFLVGFCGAVGIMLHAWIIGPVAMPRLRLVALALAAASALLGIGVQGGLMAAAGGLSDPAIWALGAGSTRGMALLLALAGLLLMAHRSRINAAAGAFACVVSFALSGHASTAPPRSIAVPALLVHVALAAFWLGSLPPLLSALRTAAGGERLRRFGRRAIVMVPLLLLAGIVLAVLQLPDVNALIATGYGAILCVKLALVAALLALAAYNRVALAPRLRTGVVPEAFRATIAAELVLGLSILAMTAVLSQTPPPRSQIAGEVAAESRSGTRTARVVVAPGRAGFNTVTVDFADAEPLEVELELSHEEAGIEPITRRMDRSGPGRFRHAGPEFAIAGRWTVLVKALVGDFERATFEMTLTLK